MKPQKIHIIIYILIFYLLLVCMGILFAYWLGMGWFFMFHTIGIFIASSPKLYIMIFGPFLNKDTFTRLKDSELIKKPQWFFPKATIVLNLINIVVTIVAFWKINIPLRIALQAILQ